MYKFLLAVKYLLNRPINLIGAIGITVAVWALILVVSIFSGYIGKMRDHVRSTASDLSLLDALGKSSFANASKLLRETPGVRGVAPRLSWYGLVDPERPKRRKPGEIDPAELAGKPAANFFQIVGIDPTAELSIRGFRDELLSVRDVAPKLAVPDPEDPFAFEVGDGQEELPTILVGYARAEQKGWDIERGAILTLTTARRQPLGARGQTQELTQRFRVAGAFRSGHFEFENATVYVDLRYMRERLRWDPDQPADYFNEVAIVLEDPDKGTSIAEALNKRLEIAEVQDRVYTWQQRGRFKRFLDNVENQRGLMRIVLFVLMAVACFLVFATLMMMVGEKTRDVGILSALGATRRGIRTIFVLCGFVISVTGAGLGVLLAWVTCLRLNAINDWFANTLDLTLFPKNIYGLDEVPYDLEPWWITLVVLIAILSTIVLSLIPAAIASRKDPVQALRQE